MSDTFSALEKTILKSKGAGKKMLKKFEELGITSKATFATVGDAQTLSDISGLELPVATAIMEWAGITSGKSKATESGNSEQTDSKQPIIIEDASVIKCTHCEHKQPKDYKTGDLCPNCGKQAEAIANCYWCYTTGTGKFCRGCGAEFVKNLEYEIAVLLKREGVSKREIIKELAEMDESEKESRLTQLRTGRY